ncbi:phosphotransferase [Sphingomonas mollis]|uniref:Phosphotransferase n=1 Tax=Sphingomonas mollis TaxID=2795726 RepID=A0ABS0XQ27_9SPHN|nr:phosphotransferase [Sphingomonas sp. BT553]MBJ6122136.1 phosphotransferase [Sphingomonas sp. BT553]
MIDVISPTIYGPDSGRRIQNIEVVRRESIVADGAAIFLVDSDYILFVSPEAFPDSAAIQRDAMVDMAQELGDQLGQMILPVIGTGHLQDRSFLILPRCKPLKPGRLGRLFQKPMVVGKILPWLRALVLHGTQGQSADREFCASLDALIDMPELPEAMRDAARRSRDAIDTGRIVVRHVPMHGDLWRNNVMQNDAGNLAIIDWAGSARQGYAIYDLVRFHQSFGMAHAKFAAELDWYCETLGGVDVVIAHLLGALGHYANRLGEFPKQRFIALANECYDLLRSGLTSAGRLTGDSR